jgi:hypothetical protein
MTLNQILNWTTSGGAIVAVALVYVAWRRVQTEFRATGESKPRVARMPARKVADVKVAAGEALADGAARSSEAPAAAPPPTAQLDQLAGGGPTVQAVTPLAQSPAPHIMLRDHVKAGPVWTASDSWLTNTTGIGSGVLAAVALAFNGGGAESAWLLGIYALSAALAPVIYGALSPSNPDSAEVTGTVAGYLLAALATMFGGIGMVATMCGLGISASNALAAGLVLGIVGALIIAAIGSYGFRTIIAVLMTETTARDGTPLGPKAASAGKPRTPSLLVGRKGRTSATL